MRFEEALKELKKDRETMVINENWNGLKNDKIMYLRMVNPLTKTVNSTEPYILMIIGTYCKKEEYKEDVKYVNCDDDGGWAFTRMPWTPSALDMWSNDWIVRK